MKKLQTQGVHHITFIGADRQTSIDFWEGVLGMPFIFEQPNLDVPEENHLYFDPGDGRLITVFTHESRVPTGEKNVEDVGHLQHIAFNVSRATYKRAKARLDERGIKNTGEVDRGFMDSLYFRDPLGLLVELACYKFQPPVGVTEAEVLLEAHKLRVERGDYNITDDHLADAVEMLTERTTRTLSDDRTVKDPYARMTAKDDAPDRHADPRG